MVTDCEGVFNDVVQKFCTTKHGGADDEIDVEYDIDNPCGAITELLNGYSNWTTQYISECNGQKNRSISEIDLKDGTICGIKAQRVEF